MRNKFEIYVFINIAIFLCLFQVKVKIFIALLHRIIYFKSLRVDRGAMLLVVLGILSAFTFYF